MIWLGKILGVFISPNTAKYHKRLVARSRYNTQSPSTSSSEGINEHQFAGRAATQVGLASRAMCLVCGGPRIETHGNHSSALPQFGGREARDEKMLGLEGCLLERGVYWSKYGSFLSKIVCSY